eukprot:jgi/Undpi1/13554/HiC_scaffold_8.g03213.m1
MGDGDVESKLKECDDHRTTQDECSIDDEGAPHQLPGRAKGVNGLRNSANIGSRPELLISSMSDSDLKSKLQECHGHPMTQHDFSIGHRGAPLEFPDYTKESYEAAATQGAGIIECDVTFTRDRELVCRHTQCDLHYTTNVLETDLAAKCTAPFVPADVSTGIEASAMCCTSDLTLAELKTLCGKTNYFNSTATTVEGYLGRGTESSRTNPYSACGTLISHIESIELFGGLGANFIPEFKTPMVDMPFEGDYTQEMFAQQMIDEYRTAGIKPDSVWVQSYELDDIEYYWKSAEPYFDATRVFIEKRFDDGVTEDSNDPSTWSLQMSDLVEKGVQVASPPMWSLITFEDGKIVPSAYAREAKAAGLEIITWALERNMGPMADGGGWFYQTVADAITKDSDMIVVMDVLARQIGVVGLLSDWPATVTYYANCILGQG